MRRIALLVLCDSVVRAGGTESYLARVLPALARRGIDIRIAARRVIEPDAFGLPATELAWGADDAPANPVAARAVASLIASWRPDAVMTSNVHDALVLEAARTAPRLIVRIHDHRLFCPQGDRQFPHFPQACSSPMNASTCIGNALLRGCAAGLNFKTLELVRSREALRSVALRADAAVVASHFMARLCVLNGLEAERVVTIPPPFEGEARRSPRSRPARDRVLFAGRLVRDKGLESLIRALGRMPAQRRPELAAAGAPTTESQPLPALAAKLSVSLSMLGRIATRELNEEIDASTLVAVPSLWPEPFGLMGIEAQARARPVVAYNVGGIPEWMGKAGLLVPRGDEAALALAIGAISERSRWEAFSHAALRQASNFGVAEHVDRLVDVIAPNKERRITTNDFARTAPQRTALEAPLTA